MKIDLVQINNVPGENFHLTVIAFDEILRGIGVISPLWGREIGAGGGGWMRAISPYIYAVKHLPLIT